MLDSRTDLSALLKDPGLLETRAYLAGEWCAADDGKTFPVRNPARGDVIAEVADVGRAETARAIAAANEAMKGWAARTAKERAQILRRWYDLMVEHADDLAAILTAEQGKPLAEAKAEILYGASFIEWFAEEGKRVYGETIPGHQPDKRLLVLRQPIGVAAAITPWNFPNAMITRKVGPALAAGCSIVVRPAALTPLSALALGVLADRAGLPKGVLSIITSTDSAGIGKEFCENETVRKLSFTGSTEVGRILLRQAADQVKKCSMELGGNAPFIVFDDADLDAAVEGAIASKYRNNGQTCVCANRIYVQAGVYDAFAEKLAARVRQMPVGDGLEPGTVLGPLINADAVAKVQEHIEDAVSKGAKIVTGGKPHALGGTFFEPTILTGVTQEMKVAREETFGPLAPLFRFERDEDVIAMANDTIFGLAAYFYARDLSRVWKVAEALEYGIVGVNTGIISTEVAPFGGVKQSGLGREGSRHGIEEYVEMKYVCMGI
ncbi:succinate-semialdehyde dehydrogenase / glutarate-semialdehyde dehydrogenase [Meinhardsimonia xiamenensis]|jgi:succinate-semialdehyde dehydrogenase/glutarate-semialdehyde dehydrogenase|uniref:Succinate-semialdehyde dehydrogenase / glutarate-semialdehyde dehydrogenase n=1 Tax=Meinhardsimonia xiamenensis TaxID=990712 RepID=A0A1G8Y7F3_9RHOB|nr:NAD-dependent succinate-semialdehyde dehydrogenase [Meinhardsimonia xiamenensis]PRX37192.1 succinate-semialdehyde dehydrogenase/glutarate-semialdehyde dehydrogenase [Meinhardsimonia xiamenensis]SDJ98663.1 succinate-semialdehyde dehydrogenase / glutarate-semialdehyde dehydrogenase [Meinhardsimonia xiamenensis]